MKKLISVIAVLGLLLGLGSVLIPVHPALAAGEVAPKTVVKEELGSGTYRVSPTMTVQRIGGTPTLGTYTASISLLPKTLIDLKTSIVCEWLSGKDISGVSYLTTGNNLFSARVTGTRVTVDYLGKESAWDPKVVIGGKTLVLISGPKVIGDSSNGYYKGNCVEWKYSADIGGFMFPRQYTVTRTLRQIEGVLSEIYTLPYDPGKDIEIISGYKSDTGFASSIPAFAYDSSRIPASVPVVETGVSKKVKAGDLFKRAYPVYIDPTLVFSTSSYDGMLSEDSTVSYAAAHNATSGDVYGPTNFNAIGQILSATTYSCMRFMTFFDTSSLPDTAAITSAIPSLYIASNIATTSFNVVVRTGGGTYPHIPPAAADYYYGNYTGSGGSLSSDNAYVNTRVSIPLNADGMSWISKTGWTKLMFMSDRDVSSISPYGYEFIQAYCYEQGTGYEPQLSVTYTMPATRPSIQTISVLGISSTSATFNGLLVNDGGAACSVNFKYGLTTGYGNTTPLVSGQYTNYSFGRTINGLESGTLYHLTAQASNSAGSSVDDDLTFLTLPAGATALAGTPGNTQIPLTWTKGVGSSKTMIRMSTTSYPTSPTSGTQVYYDTGASYTKTSLTNGVAYYFTAFGYAEGGGFTAYSTSGSQYSGTPFTTGPPAVSDYNATLVTTTTATLNGRLDSLNGYSDADVWFQYYWGAGTWTDNESTPETKTAAINVTSAVATLPASTLIHFRVGAISDGGTTYSTGRTFTTGAVSAPSMLTQAATGILQQGAVLHGKVVSDSGEAVTGWFQYGTTINYGSTTDSASGLLTNSTLYAALSGLDIGTTYHFRVVGQNTTGGISYGADLTFITTSPAAPTGTTNAAIEVGALGATLKGTLTTSGGVPCEVRFNYGDTTAYGTDTGWITDVVPGQVVTQVISGLTLGTTYHYRFEFKNITATVQGSDVTFTTVFSEPTGFTAEALSSSTITLRWVNVGDQTGIFMKKGSCPADRLDGTQVYFGNAQSTSIGSLEMGTTYFFRAYSWKVGDAWSTTYSDAIATTSASAQVGSVPTDPVVLTKLPDTPGGFWQSPSGAAFTSWPFYDVFEDSATLIGMPSSTIWFIIAIVMIGGIMMLIALVTHQIWIISLAAGGMVAAASMMGLVPGWIGAMFGILGVGGAVLTAGR